jgi:Malectin domain/Kelch motif
MRSISLPLALFLLAPSFAQEACWDVLADCPQERFEAVSLVIDDLLYVFGGSDSINITTTDRVDVYDPLADSWSTRAPLPNLLTHTAVALDDRTVWLVAGFVGGHPGVATDATWTYDVDLDIWSPGPPLPKAAGGGALVRFDRNLHWFGGLEADGDTSSPDHYVLDLDNPGLGWGSLAPLPVPRSHLSGARVGNFIHAFGGQDYVAPNSFSVDAHHAYDPQTDTWTALAPLPFPRSHFTAGTVVSGGKAIIVGGKSTTKGLGSLIDVTEYDPLLDQWSALPPLPQPRFGVVARIIQNRLYATTGAEADLTPDATTLGRDVSFTFGGHMRVNCGGPQYTDTALQEWCSDLGYRNGIPFANPLVPDVGGTVEDELYRTHRTGDNNQPTIVSYRIPADNGKYRLVLHFAEIQHGATGFGGPAAGQRVMRMTVEDEVVKTGFDVGAEVGAEVATTLTYDFEVTDGDADFHVIATTGFPMLAAFELIDLPDNAFETFCSAGPNSTGSPALIRFRGSSSLQSSDLRLLAETVPDGQFGLFFYSALFTDVPFGNGQRCLASPLYRLPVKPVNGGMLTHQVNFSNLPNGGEILAGSTWGFQAWYRDPVAGGANYDSSDALRMLFTN